MPPLYSNMSSTSLGNLLQNVSSTYTGRKLQDKKGSCRQGHETGLWRTIKRCFMSYLYVSGHLLAPWTNHNSSRSIDLNPTLIAGFLSLVPGASSLTAQNQKVDAISRKSLTDPINVISSIPVFAATPNGQISEDLYLKEYFALSDLSNNLQLSIERANGSAAPDWLSLEMGELSLIRNFYLNGNQTYDVAVSGQNAYVALSNGLQVLDISNPSNPVVIGNKIDNGYNLGNYGGRRFILAKGDVVYIANSSRIDVYDVSNPANILLKNSIINDYSNVDMDWVGNYIFNVQVSANAAYLTTIDITDLIQPVILSTFNFYNGTTSTYKIKVVDKYAFISRSDLKVIDISNVASPLLVDIPKISSNAIAVRGKYMYSQGLNLEVYDITQITKPQLLNFACVGSSGTNYILDGDNIYSNVYSSNVGLYVIDVKNWRDLNYFQLNTMGWIQNGVVANNNFIIAQGATLSLYDTSKRKLTGVPSSSDRGLLQLNVIASDESGNEARAPLTLRVGDVHIASIPNQSAYVGSATLFTFAPETFDYPGASFIYTAGLAGGLPLPAFISFDANTRTFLFAPQSEDRTSYQIEITADDGFGGISSTTFNLNIPNRPPIVEQPLTDQVAYSGEAFEYVFLSEAFTDLDGDALGYSAQQAGYAGLPGWLNFDPIARRFYGIPFGKNVYAIEVTANDEHGGVATHTFNITVPNSAPIIFNQPANQIAKIDTPFSYTLEADIFYDVDNDPLEFSAAQLPEFLTFNSAARTFTGTPRPIDIGTYTITISAQDDSFESVSTSFKLSVLGVSNNNPPVLLKEIPDTTVTAGQPFSYSFSIDTFADPEEGALTYLATLEGGAALPSGLYFDSDTRTLSGDFPTAQLFRISIRAVDPYGAYAIDTFSLNIVENLTLPPIVLNELPNQIATVDQPFYFHIPNETFASVSGDNLEISINQAGGKPLPKWIKWEPSTNSFSGTPGPWDTGTYKDAAVSMEVWASDGVGSVKSTFQIIVQGESFWETFLKAGISIGSIATSALGFYKSRAVVWNYLRKDKYRKQSEKGAIGTLFSRKLQLEYNQIKELRAFHQDKPMIDLPAGLRYENNCLLGTPKAGSEGTYTVRIYDHKGYINEEFDLTIE